MVEGRSSRDPAWTLWPNFGKWAILLLSLHPHWQINDVLGNWWRCVYLLYLLLVLTEVQCAVFPLDIEELKIKGREWKWSESLSLVNKQTLCFHIFLMLSYICKGEKIKCQALSEQPIFSCLHLEYTHKWSLQPETIQPESYNLWQKQSNHTCSVER